MDERCYWIWMQHAFLPGSPKPFAIAQRFNGDLEAFCSGGRVLWDRADYLSDSECEALSQFSLEHAKAQLDYALALGWQVVTPGCEEYPALLAEIHNPPAALYVLGELPDWDEALSIAVVGARNAREQTLREARSLGCQLAVSGATLIAGGALGVDSEAVSGALSVPGSRIVCVLPVSLDSGYVRKNEELRQKVLRHGGALVSEYFSQQAPTHGTFPVRNRLITGMSRGVVLLQAKSRSGTILYAGHAADQNRDVFVVPGPQGDPDFAGGEALVRDGAKEVRSAQDILEEYPPARLRRRHYRPVSLPLAQPSPRTGSPGQQTWEEHRQPMPPIWQREEEQVPREPRPVQPEPEGEAGEILRALGGDVLSLEELSRKSGLAVGPLLAQMTQLELMGLVESLPGKRYQRAR